MQITLTHPSNGSSSLFFYGSDAFLDALEQGYTLPADFSPVTTDGATGLITAMASPRELLLERKFRRGEEAKRLAWVQEQASRANIAVTAV